MRRRRHPYNDPNGDWWTYFGGGVLLENAPITVSSNRIVNNHAGAGGGISLFNSDATIVNNTISNNTADHEGGGIDMQQSSPLVLDDVLSGNYPNGVFSFHDISGTYGAQGPFPQTVGPTIVNTLIAGNSGPSQPTGGSGIEIWGSKLTLVNTTVAGNNEEGIASANPAVDTVSITNSIIYGNTSIDIFMPTRRSTIRSSARAATPAARRSRQRIRCSSTPAAATTTCRQRRRRSTTAATPRGPGMPPPTSTAIHGS